MPANTSSEGSVISVNLSASQERVKFSVHNSGEPIPPEYQQRLFERFYRIDKARSRSDGGVGLGTCNREKDNRGSRRENFAHKQHHRWNGFHCDIAAVNIGYASRGHPMPPRNAAYTAITPGRARFARAMVFFREVNSRKNRF